MINLQEIIDQSISSHVIFLELKYIEEISIHVSVILKSIF